VFNVSTNTLSGGPLGAAEGLLEAVSFKKAMESIGRGRVMNGNKDGRGPDSNSASDT